MSRKNKVKPILGRVCEIIEKNDEWAVVESKGGFRYKIYSNGEFPFSFGRGESSKSSAYRYQMLGIQGHSVYLHKLVAEIWLPNPEKKPFVDHINGDKKDFRLENLRWATVDENSKAFKNISGSSHFRGVCWDKKSKKWMAYLTVNKKLKHFGRFNDEIDAAKAFNRAALKHNYPKESFNDLSKGHSPIQKEAEIDKDIDIFEKYLKTMKCAEYFLEGDKYTCFENGSVFMHKSKTFHKSSLKYSRVGRKGGKTEGIHRMIFAAFNSLKISDLPEVINHIDGNPKNNSIKNLEASSKRHNAQSFRKSSRESGISGVFKRDGKYLASISKNKIKYRLGTYKNKAEAAYAVEFAADHLKMVRKSPLEIPKNKKEIEAKVLTEIKNKNENKPSDKKWGILYSKDCLLPWRSFFRFKNNIYGEGKFKTELEAVLKSFSILENIRKNENCKNNLRVLDKIHTKKALARIKMLESKQI